MNSEQTSGPQNTYHVVTGRDGEKIQIFGRLLGFATSNRDTHEHPTDASLTGEIRRFAEIGTRCSACRWFEVRIYAVEYEKSADGDDSLGRTGRYLVETSGVSVVPDEMIMHRASWTDSAYEVVELLTQRRGERPFLPGPSARVLAQAAAWDSGIRDAYVDRAVI